MGLFSKLFGGATPPAAPDDDGEQAVIVHFQYGATDLEPLSELENELRTAIDETGIGEYDGHEIAVDGSDGVLYMYGPDADRLFEAARPVMEKSSFMKGAVATVRYGPPADDTPQKEVTIGG